MKNTRIKFSSSVNACLSAVMIPQHSGLPKHITFKTVKAEDDDIRTMNVQISEEEDAFITEQSTNTGVSKAEMIEAILETCFQIGITEQGKKWIVDSVIDVAGGDARTAKYVLCSKQQFVKAIIRFIQKVHPNSQKVQKVLQEQAVKVRGKKRNYSKSNLKK